MMDNIRESVISSQFRSDDDNEDETTYNYDDELVMDLDDDAVQAGKTFIEDGREWQWIKQIGDVEHIDFDNWAVWFATDVDTQDGGYFIVDIDTGFIDWGPVDTEEEAKEFLQSKVDDEDIDFSIADYEDDYYVDESAETLKEDSLDDMPWSREQAINRIISVYEDASDDYQDYIVSELVRLSGFPDESYIGGIDIDESVWERISDKQLKWLDNTISLDDSNKRKVNNSLQTDSKEVLQEDDTERVSATIPNDLLNNPDKVDFKSYIGRRSADAKAEKERHEKEARMAERASKYKDAIDHAQELMERDDTIEALDVLFDALVPQSGPADTVAGELVRAMMRILHRDYNDGDLFYEGYGIETCGSSVAYIIDVIGDQLIDTFEKIALRQLQDDSYTQALKEVTKAVVKAILNNNEYITTDNEEDSRSRKWEQDYENRFKDNWEPRYDYSFDVADEIYEHIHEGNITMQDVVSRMEDNLMYQSGFDGVEVYSSGEDLIIDNLTRDALEELDDWNRNSDQYWSDYINELNDEYGDPDDDLSDEELDESKSIKEDKYTKNTVESIEESLTEDKGQPRSNRYRTYFNRIKRAIEKGDEETLKRTKEAIMYAPAKELKNSEADELMDMIKNRKITESISGKYGEVKYVPRRDGMHGESAIYANYYLFLDDGKYTPYWAGERPMGSSYSSVENAVKGIDAFIDRQHKDGKMLHMKPVNEASYGGAYDNEAKNIINVLNKNLRVRFKHSAGGIFFLDRTPFNEDTFNELIKNNYKMIGDILEEQGLKYDISEDAYISKDTNLYVTIYGDTNGIIVQFEEMESESLKESVNSDIVSMIKKQFPEATVKTSVRKHSDVHKSNPDTPVGKTKYVDIKITPDSASSVNSILQYCNHNIKKVLDSNSRFYYYGDVPARNPRGSKEVVLSYQDYSGLSDDEYKSLLGESVGPTDLLERKSVSYQGLKDKLTKELNKVMKSPEFGFEDDEIKEYSGVEVKEDKGQVYVSVWAEVGYDALWTIKDALDPIIAKYDKDAYFDMEDAGRLLAVISDSKLKESGNSFKSNHICQGCGKPLDQCTCEIKEEDIDLNNLEESQIKVFGAKEKKLDEATDTQDYRVVTVAMDVAMPADKRLEDYGVGGGGRNDKLYSALSRALESVGLEMAGDYIDSVGEVTQVYKDNEYEFELDESLKESPDDSTNRNSVYYKVLSKLSAGVATSKIYNQPNVGLTFDIEPTDDAINKVVSKLKSLGFTEVDRYEDDNYLNDSYIVFTNEINGERVVCGIVYNARNNFAFVTAGYDEAEDSEYFDSYKNATQESYKLGALNRYKESLLDEDIDIDSNEDIDVEETNQKYTSAKTSINSSKIPAIFNMINLQPGTINLDFGGGKFDNVAEYLADKDVTNLVYDPYNRSSEHNKEVINKVKANGGADSATISNVLNVIAEESARNIVLNNVYRLTKPDATIYITVYEGDSSGNPGETKSGYQLNRKTTDYMEEIEKVFPNVVRKGKLIIAKK